MKVYICPQASEQGKFLGVIQAFPAIWQGRILDVGSRSAGLKQMLLQQRKQVSYIGLDIQLPADIIANLEKGLPFDDRIFDVVVALDVLEHTDDIHHAFDELCRIARQFVVLTLPNAYELKSRVKFVLGLPLSGKYGLPTERPPDRYRWLFSLNEARSFVHKRAYLQGFRVADEGCLIGPHRAATGGKFLTKVVPNLLSPWYLCLLKRDKGCKE